MHCINVILVKKEFLKKELNQKIIQVELPQGIIAIPNLSCTKTHEAFGESVLFLTVATDYFGGGGEQNAQLNKTTDTGYSQQINFTGNSPINSALKTYGIVCEDDMDEFDTIKLGRYRNNEDFGYNGYTEESEFVENDYTRDEYFDNDDDDF